MVAAESGLFALIDTYVRICFLLHYIQITITRWYTELIKQYTNNGTNNNPPELLLHTNKHLYYVVIGCF